MKSHKSFALLLALAAVVSTSTPSVGQSLLDAGRSLTVDEKAYLMDITGEFCEWLNISIEIGRPLPEGDLKLRSGSITPEEAKSLYPVCDQLMRLMRQAADANRKQRPLRLGISGQR